MKQKDYMQLKNKYDALEKLYKIELSAIKYSLKYKIGEAIIKSTESPREFALLLPRLIIYFYIGLKKKFKKHFFQEQKPNINKAPNLSNISVDIILPIHNALEDVQECISSLYETKTFDFNLIVVDDASDNETKKYLEKKSKELNFLLVRNEVNLKFTKAVNKGLKLTKSNYVILLNSDTVVTHKWIEKILKCFLSEKKIGVVGTLSNAASWQSVPERTDENNAWKINAITPLFSIKKTGKLIEVLSKKLYPKVPSVNGFLLYRKTRIN